MKITSRTFVHVDVNEEGTVMCFRQSREQWENNICPGSKVGKLLSSDGRDAIFFTCPEMVNYRVAMGVVGSYARHIKPSWDIPF